MIRIRRDEENADGGYVCIFEDDGMSVSQKKFHTIAELVAILKPDPDEDQTFVEAVAVIIDRFRAVLKPSVWSIQAIIYRLKKHALGKRGSPNTRTV